MTMYPKESIFVEKKVSYVEIIGRGLFSTLLIVGIFTLVALLIWGMVK